MVKAAVFASGNGSNFENLLLASKNKEINCEICVLIVDKSDAYAIKRAQKFGLPYYFVNISDFSCKDEFEKHIIGILNKYRVEYIFLAGYMRIISSVLLDKFKNKIINIHPSFLPNFTGKDAIKRSFDCDEGYGGVSVHFVDAGIDTGEIIYQEKLLIKPEWNLQKFEEEIHKLEYVVYKKALNKILGDKDEKSIN